MTDIDQILISNNLRVTEPRRIIHSVLNSADQPLTAYQIQSLVSLTDRATIYRTLQLFERLNLVKKIMLDENVRYELAEPYTEHHHHFICTACFKVFDLKIDDFEKSLKKNLKKRGYKHQSHSIEIMGVCNDHTT